MSRILQSREENAALFWAGVIGVLGAMFFASIYLLDPASVPPRSLHVPNQDARPAAIPSLEPQRLEPLTPQQAKVRNDALPFVINGIEHAPAFRFGEARATTIDYTNALDCLTAAVYYEAGGESEQGKRAVAQVVLNRVRHPAFPATICGVVYQGSDRASGCQFSFTCDGSLTRPPSIAGWALSRRISLQALAGAVEASVGMSTHYHASWVVPYWAPHLDKIAQIGGHIFYRWPGYWGSRHAFSRSYNGESVSFSKLTLSALAAQAEIINPADIVPPGPQSSLAGRSQMPQPSVVGDDLVQTVLADAKAATPLADWNPSRLLADDQSQSIVRLSTKGIEEKSIPANATLDVPN